MILHISTVMIIALSSYDLTVGESESAKEGKPTVSILNPDFGEGHLEVDVQINLEKLRNDMNKCQNDRCLILNCKSNYPVDWIIENATQTPFGSQIIVHNKIVENWSNSKYNIVEFISELILLKPRPENSGCFICQGINSTTKPLLTRHFLFIQSPEPSRPKLIEHNKVKVVFVEDELIVPCRPDNPNQAISLFHNGKEIGNEQSVFYNPYYGFNLTNDAISPVGKLPRHGKQYECRTFGDWQERTFLVIRVLPKQNIQILPRPEFVAVEDGMSLQLNCSVGQLETMIIQPDLRHPGNAISIQNVKKTDAGNYYCVVKESNNEITIKKSIHDFEIIHKWDVVIQGSSEIVKINFTILTDDYFGSSSAFTGSCDTGNSRVEPKFWQCPCIGDLSCNRVKTILSQATDASDCLNVRELCQRKRSGLTSCGTGNKECRLANIEKSGFLVCSAPPTRSFRDDSKKSRTEFGLSNECLADFKEVIAGIKEPSLASDKFKIQENGDCIKVGGSEALGTAGYFWINGKCEVLLGQTTAISCTAHRNKYSENISWLIRKTGEQQLSPVANGSTIFGFSFIFETQITEESITSTLKLDTHQQTFAGSFLCNVYNIQHGIFEEVEIPVHVKAVVNAKFKNGDSEETKENVEINFNEEGLLDCSVTEETFPTPKWTWYKKVKDMFLPLDLNEKGPDHQHSEFRNMKLSYKGDQLQFLSFSSDQVGNYRCKVIQKLLNGPDFVLQKDFYVEGVDLSSTLIIVVIVLTIIGLIAVGFACLYSYRYRIERIRVQALTEKEIYEFINGNVEAINQELDIAEQAHLLPYKNEFEFPKEKLKFGKQLGAGAYGTVMKAIAEGILKHEQTTTVAVKTVQPNADILYFKALLTELKIMIHIGKHMNVVSLLGAITEELKNREVFLIVEYCRYGNVQHYLHKNRKSFVNQIRDGKINTDIRTNDDLKSSYQNMDPESLLQRNLRDGQVSLDYENTSAGFNTSGGSDFPENTSGSSQPLWRNNIQGDYVDTDIDLLNTTHLLSWTYQIACGMEYLADKKVIHGDLATRNILLADKNIVKVADFGLARQVYKDANYIKKQKCPLPVKWMAIESLTRMQFSSKSDVWAFGIVLWELFSLGDNPYPGVSVDSEFLAKLQQGYRMKQPKFATDDLYNTMVECWREEPDDRPSFKDLSDALGVRLKQTKKDCYFNLSRLMENSNTTTTLQELPSSSLSTEQEEPLYQNCD